MTLKNLIMNLLFFCQLLANISPSLIALPAMMVAPSEKNSSIRQDNFLTNLPHSLRKQHGANDFLNVDHLKTMDDPSFDANAVLETQNDAQNRMDLPKSVYIIYFWAADGRCRKHVGVAIHPNALLSSNHFLPLSITSDNVFQIQIRNAYGDVHDIADPSEFVIEPSNAFTTIVFKEKIIPEENTAKLGNMDDLRITDQAYQAVIKGAPEGIYPTQIEGSRTILNLKKQEYLALVISTDRTTTSDSGSPLYVNDLVYGVNNSGNGNYGMITDPELVYRNIEQISLALNQGKEA